MGNKNKPNKFDEQNDDVDDYSRMDIINTDDENKYFLFKDTKE